MFPQSTRPVTAAAFPFATVAAFVAMQASGFALTFSFTYGTAVPAELETAVDYAGGLWESWLVNTATGDQETLEIDIDYVDLGAGILGSAGPSWMGGLGSSAFVPSMYMQVVGGPDFNATDGVINFSNRFSWYFGTDGATPGGSYDALSVALHEIGHQVGFMPTYQWSTADTWGVKFGDADYRLTPWDELLRDAEGDAPIAGGGDSFNEVDNPVYFVGSSAVAANGGDNVPIYAPSSYNAGSSLSHLAEQSPFSSYLMSYSLSTGEAVHSLASVELGILRDMGWTVYTDIPEPSAFALLAVGLVAVAGRRRRTRLQ